MSVSPSPSPTPSFWRILLPVIGLILCLLNLVVLMTYLELSHHSQKQQQPQQEATSLDIVSSNTVVSPESVLRHLPSHAKMRGIGAPSVHEMRQQSAVHVTHVASGHRDEPNDKHDTTKASHVGQASEQDGAEEEEWKDRSHDNSREPLLRILREAGMLMNDTIMMDKNTLNQLPTWSDITRLYGSKPRIYGLETCHVFRNHSNPADHFIGTAGNFNSGTNLLSELLIHNCQMTKRMETYGNENKGIRWQVPWGKHSPPLDETFRTTHKTKPGDAGIDAHNVMPIVTIRDPYVWMQSMCRHSYEAYWPHKDNNGHCPNLVPDERDIEAEWWLKYKQSVPIDVQYSTFTRQHDSLVHFWNDWYDEYLRAPFPRLIIRFEDLVFHSKQVVTTVCHCAGGELMSDEKFTYIVDSAKKGTPGAHGSSHDRTSLFDALVRYGKDTHRLDGFTKDDIDFARKNLNHTLMNLFGYQFA